MSLHTIGTVPALDKGWARMLTLTYLHTCIHAYTALRGLLKFFRSRFCIPASRHWLFLRHII